jgi:hypothetical protein
MCLPLAEVDKLFSKRNTLSFRVHDKASHAKKSANISVIKLSNHLCNMTVYVSCGVVIMHVTLTVCQPTLLYLSLQERRASQTRQHL